MLSEDFRNVGVFCTCKKQETFSFFFPHFENCKNVLPLKAYQFNQLSLCFGDSNIFQVFIKILKVICTQVE